MSILGLLYEISTKDIDILHEKEMLLKLSVFGNIETKSLLLYKISGKIDSQNYPIALDIVDLILETTDFSEKTTYIYKYLLKILEKSIDFVVPNSLEYYKAIILLIKTIKITKNKIPVNLLINKMLNKMEEIDRMTFIRHISSQKQNLNINLLPTENINSVLRTIIVDLGSSESIPESYLTFLKNLCYPPHITNVDLENIIKIIKVLGNFKRKTKSIKIRQILVDVVYSYINKKDIEYLVENFEKLRYNLFVKHLLTVRVVKEIAQNPELINNSKVRKVLSKLSFDKSSLIRSYIFSTDYLPLYMRVNSFKIRKYNVQALEKYWY